MFQKFSTLKINILGHGLSNKKTFVKIECANKNLQAFEIWVISMKFVGASSKPAVSNTFFQFLPSFCQFYQKKYCARRISNSRLRTSFKTPKFQMPVNFCAHTQFSQTFFCLKGHDPEYWFSGWKISETHLLISYKHATLTLKSEWWIRVVFIGMYWKKKWIFDVFSFAKR